VYETYFGLKEMPFTVMPDPRYAYRSMGHKLAEGKMRFAADYRSGLAVLTGPIGSGKCLGKGTPILMYDGSVKLVEEIVPGELLMGPDSMPRRVISLARGVENMYRILPVHGDDYVVNEAHILSLRYRDRSGEDERIINISVAEYLKKSERFRREAKGWRVGVDFPSATLPLEPYFLGVFLARLVVGGEDFPSERGNIRLRLHAEDAPLADYLRDFALRSGVSLRRVIDEESPRRDVSTLPRTHESTATATPSVTSSATPSATPFAIYEMEALTTGHFKDSMAFLHRNPVRDALIDLGIETESGDAGERRIPQRCRVNDTSARLELLAGLLDADGFLDENSRSTFTLTVKGEAFADDICFVARSLGFAAYKRGRRRIDPGTGTPAVCWRVSITGDTQRIPTRLSRNQANPRRNKNNVLRSGIREVRWIGRDEYYGFEIDGDRLFVLGDFTVTHNTTTANLLVHDWSDDKGKSVAFLPSADERGRAAFLRRIMDGFGVVSTARNYADNRDQLERFLLDTHKDGKHAILVIDEAQKIHAENFDTLTDLTNFQTATDKFLTIILFAQDNLRPKLVRKDSFTSRIAFEAHLDPLSYEDMRLMIAHRLRVGGARLKGTEEKPDLSPFISDDALVDIYKTTRGVPRDVCILINDAFLTAYIANEKPVNPNIVRQTVDNLSRVKRWPVPPEISRKTGSIPSRSRSGARGTK